MRDLPARARRGLVLLYAVTVFSVIATIGFLLLDSGQSYVGTVNTDYHLLVAQQAAFSGLAYGEAMIQKMLNLASAGTYPYANNGVNVVPGPAWCARFPSGAPFNYYPLQGAKGAPGSDSDQTGPVIRANTDAVTYTYTTEVRGGAETVRSVFRIELRECSRPYAPAPAPNPATAGCGANLFDENLMRQDFFWQGGGSPYKPNANPQAFGLIAPPDTFFYYTLRVEGEARARNPGTSAFDTVARVVVKEPFIFRIDTPRRIQPQAFWFQDTQRGY